MIPRRLQISRRSSFKHDVYDKRQQFNSYSLVKGNLNAIIFAEFVLQDDRCISARHFFFAELICGLEEK